MTGLLEWLRSIEPWDEEFPDVDAGLLPLDEVDLFDGYDPGRASDGACHPPGGLDATH